MMDEPGEWVAERKRGGALKGRFLSKKYDKCINTYDIKDDIKAVSATCLHY